MRVCAQKHHRILNNGENNTGTRIRLCTLIAMCGNDTHVFLCDGSPFLEAPNPLRTDRYLHIKHRSAHMHSSSRYIT